MGEVTLHYLQEHHLLVFLVQVLLLLGLARGLGYLCTRVGQPAILGEIVTGVLLGRTILGRAAPAAHDWLFPANPLQHAMLETVAWVGLLLLLLAAGLEVDVSVAWRQRRDAFKIAVTDIVLPMAVAFVPALLLPDRYLADPAQRLLFALFIATVMTISALPMSVKTLHDLGLLKTDLGLLIMSALTINDIIGWAIFTMVLGVAGQAGPNLGHLLLVLAGTVGFAALCLTVFRRLVVGAVGRVKRGVGTDAGLVLTFVCCLGLAAGVVTQALGVHALFGFFLAGIMAGDAPALSEQTRQVINRMVYAVFVPIFFATIGLQIDFLANFDVWLVLLLTVVGVGGRYLGAWVGARMTSLSRWDRVSVAIAHTPGGSMEMVVAFIALQVGLITGPVFVAIVFAAVASSVALGPWMAWSVRRRPRVALVDLFARRAAPLDLAATTRTEAIRELCEAAAEEPGMPDADTLLAAVRAREETAGTALGNAVAAPHARLAELKRPVVVAGRSACGIEWNTPDGLPVHLAFLILTPRGRDDLQVQVLGGVARAVGPEEVRRRLLAAADSGQARAVLRDVLGGQDVIAPPR